MAYCFPYYLSSEKAYLGYAEDEGTPRTYRTLEYVGRCVVPAELDGHPVAAVYDVEIPPCDVLEFEEGIEEIDLSGVEKSVREVILPSSLQTLCPASFAGTENLERVVIPAGLIRPYAFRDCRALREVVLGDGVAGIRSAAFRGCDALEEIVLPDGVESLCHPEDAPWLSGAFVDCASLRRVVIGSGLREMWCNPFAGCNALTEIAVSPRNTFYTVREGMLIDRRRSMLVAVLPRSDGRLAIPPDIMEIAANALKGCAWLTHVEYASEHVTNTRSDAFAGCTALKSAVIDGNVDGRAFADCPALETVHLRRCCEVEEEAFARCPALREVVIDDGAEYIAAYAFGSCGLLACVRIPASVMMMDEEAFAGNAEKAEVIAPRGSYAQVFAAAMGMQFRADGETERCPLDEEARRRLLHTDLAELIAPDAELSAMLPYEAACCLQRISLRGMRRLRSAGIHQPVDLLRLTITDMRMRRLPVGACLSLLYLTGYVWNPA